MAVAAASGDPTEPFLCSSNAGLHNFSLTPFLLTVLPVSRAGFRVTIKLTFNHFSVHLLRPLFYQHDWRDGTGVGKNTLKQHCPRRERHGNIRLVVCDPGFKQREGVRLGNDASLILEAPQGVWNLV